MAKKKEYSPSVVDFEVVGDAKYAKTTKKNDLINITNDLGNVVVKASKGNDAISFDGFQTVEDLKNTDKITFTHVAGTKDLLITLLDTSQTVTVENYFKKVDGKATASSLKNIRLNDENGSFRYVSIVDEGLIDYENAIYANKKGKATGTAFNDTMYGSIKNDTIKGNGGNDIIDAGTGNDKIYGGKGADTFVFGTYQLGGKFYGSGMDTVYDSEDADTLEFSTSNVEELKFEQVKKDLKITYIDKNDETGATTENVVTVKNYYDRSGARVKNFQVSALNEFGELETFDSAETVRSDEFKEDMAEKRAKQEAIAAAKAAKDAQDLADYNALTEAAQDKDYESVAAQIADLDADLEQTKSDLNTAEANYETAQANYEQKIAELAAYEADHEKTNEEYATLLTQKNTAQSNYETAQENYEQAIAELTEYEGSHSHNDTEWGTLLAEKNTAQSNYETAQANYVAANTALTTYQATHTKTDTQYATLLEQKTTAETNLATAQADLATAQTALTEYQATHTKTDTQYATLQTQKAQAESDLADAEAQVTTLSGQVTTLTGERDALQAQLDAIAAGAKDHSAFEEETINPIKTSAYDRLVFENSSFKNCNFIKEGADLTIEYFDDKNGTAASGSLTITNYFTTAQADRIDAFVDKDGLTHSLTDMLLSLNIIEGTSGTDAFTGTASKDIFIANGGDDIVAAASSVNDVLQLSGDPDNIRFNRVGTSNDMTIIYDGGTVLLKDYFTDNNLDTIKVGDTTLTISDELATRLTVTHNGTTANDTFTGTDYKDRFIANDGNDTVTAASKTNDVLVLSGDPDNITLDKDNASNDMTITYDNGTTVLKNYFTDANLDTVEVGDATLTLSDELATRLTVTHNGTTANDTFTGTDYKDVFVPVGGVDTISTSAGTDTIKFTENKTITYGKGIDDNLYIYYGNGNTVTLTDYFDPSVTHSVTTIDNNGTEVDIATDLADKGFEIVGTSGADNITTYTGTIRGGQGDDYMYNGGETSATVGSTFVFAPGDGHDTIDNQGVGRGSAIKFEEEQTLTYSRYSGSNDLIIGYGTLGDTITLKNFFTNNGVGNWHAINTIYNGDTTLLLKDDFKNGMTIYGGKYESLADAQAAAYNGEMPIGTDSRDNYILRGGWDILNLSGQSGKKDYLYFETDPERVWYERVGNDCYIHYEDGTEGNENGGIAVVTGYFGGWQQNKFNKIVYGGVEHGFNYDIQGNLDSPNGPGYWLYGTDGDDVLDGVRWKKYIVAGEGDDDITTGGGPSTVYAGTGTDSIHSGADQNTHIFYTGDGVDTLDWVDGVTKQTAGVLNDALRDNIRIDNTNPVEIFYVKSADEHDLRIIYSETDEVVIKDFYNGKNFAKMLYNGKNDYVGVNLDDITLTSSRIYATSSNMTLKNVKDFEQTLVFETATDLSFEKANDSNDLLIKYTVGSTPVRITLKNYYGENGHSIKNIENGGNNELVSYWLNHENTTITVDPDDNSDIYDTPYVDVIQGNDQDTTIHVSGADGNTVYTGGGDDVIDARECQYNDFHFLNGNGHDTIVDAPNTGEGRNVIHFDDATDTTGFTFQRLGDDLIIHYTENDSVTLQDWYTRHWHSAAVYTIGNSDTEYRIDELVSDHVEVIAPVEGGTMNGDYQNNTFTGSDNADTITTGAGTNTVTAGKGDDTISGQGADGNTYIFRTGDGHDTIMHTQGGSTVRFTETQTLSYSKDGDDLLIWYGEGEGQAETRDSIRLKDFYKDNGYGFTINSPVHVINNNGAEISILYNNIEGRGNSGFNNLIASDADATLNAENANANIPVTFFAGNGNTTMIGGSSSDSFWIREGNSAWYEVGDSEQTHVIKNADSTDAIVFDYNDSEAYTGKFTCTYDHFGDDLILHAAYGTYRANVKVEGYYTAESKIDKIWFVNNASEGLASGFSIADLIDENGWSVYTVPNSNDRNHSDYTTKDIIGNSAVDTIKFNNAVTINAFSVDNSGKFNIIYDDNGNNTVTISDYFSGRCTQNIKHIQNGETLVDIADIINADEKYLEWSNSTSIVDRGSEYNDSFGMTSYDSYNIASSGGSDKLKFTSTIGTFTYSRSGDNLVITNSSGAGQIVLTDYFGASGHSVQTIDNNTTIINIADQVATNALYATNNRIATLTFEAAAWQSAGASGMAEYTVPEQDTASLMQIYTNNA